MTKLTKPQLRMMNHLMTEGPSFAGPMFGKIGAGRSGWRIANALYLKGLISVKGAHTAGDDDLIRLSDAGRHLMMGR